MTQYQYVTVGPGVQIGLRVTRDGRVMMLATGGEIDVTDGAGMLAVGVAECNARASLTRARRTERKRAP